jgi:poly-gamma-glutamate capsule biosynthesis protein CapA/YwtB (metallophosphatase superfamily)
MRQRKESFTKQRASSARCLVLSFFAASLVSACASDPSVSIVLLGDVMLARGVAAAHAGGDWNSALESLAPILHLADIAAANLESPLACGLPPAEGDRTLVAPPESADALAAAGLDVLTAVNNHARDAGDSGQECTRADLADRGILAVTESISPLELTVHGIGVSFLAADFIDPVSPDYLSDLERAIREEKAAGRLVVVSLHWGMEYQSGNDALQTAVARSLSGAGADILWGHHPHVVQPSAWMGGTLVLYSLGNALFDQPEPGSARRGEIVWIEADRSGVRSFATATFAIHPQKGIAEFPDPFSLRIFFSPARSPGK